MKAVVCYGPKQIRVQEVPEPQVKGRKVLVKFKAGSICGTDLHLYRGDWKIKRGRIPPADLTTRRAAQRKKPMASKVTDNATIPINANAASQMSRKDCAA